MVVLSTIGWMGLPLLLVADDEGDRSTPPASEFCIYLEFE